MARTGLGIMNSIGNGLLMRRGRANSAEDAAGKGEDRGSVSSWFRNKINDMTISDSMDVPETSEWSDVNYELEASGDLKYCPACIEAADFRKEGRRRLLFVIPYKTSPVTPHTQTDVVLGNSVCRLRSYAEFVRSLSTFLVPIPKQHKNKKLSIAEKRRRHIVMSMSSLLSKENSAAYSLVNTFLGSVADSDKHFLSTSPFLHTTSKTSVERWECGVAMATSRRHWSEEYMVLTRSEISIYKSKDTKRASFQVKLFHLTSSDILYTLSPPPLLQIPMHTVLSVRAMRRDEVPMQNFYFFQVSTVIRVYYFLVLSEPVLRSWLAAFNTVFTHSEEKNFSGDLLTKLISPNRSKSLSIELDEGAYLARPSDWKMDKRRVYNYRRILFRDPSVDERPSPILVAENMLRIAFSLHSNQTSSSKWIEFLDAICFLQVTITLDSLFNLHVFLSYYFLFFLQQLFSISI